MAQSLHLPPPIPPSKLVLADQIITLAQTADRAGYRTTADRLVRLASVVMVEPRVSQ
jgi:hypothetical protein